MTATMLDVFFLQLVLVHLSKCQLFGPFGNYAPGLLNYLGLPGLGGNPFPFLPQTRSAAFAYPPFDFSYGASFAPASSLLLPKMPFKTYSTYDKIFPAASYERPLIALGSRGQIDGYQTDPTFAYPSKTNKNISQRERQVNLKPSSNGNGNSQSFGQYAAYLKALLSGQPPTTSYSSDSPLAKSGPAGSVLGNDYSSLSSKSFASNRPEIEPQWLNEKPDSFAKSPEEPGAFEKKVTFTTFLPFMDPKLMTAESLNPFDSRISSPRELLVNYADKGSFPDSKYPDPLASAYLEKRIPLPYPGGGYDPYLQERRQIYNLYDVPNYLGFSGKPGPAYGSTFPQAQEQDLSAYEFDQNQNYQAKKQAFNMPTYFPGVRDRQEFKKEQTYPDRKTAPGSSDGGYNNGKYPSLGYDLDQKKPMPAVIAALFGGGKYGRTSEYYGPDSYDRMTAQKSSYDASPRNGYPTSYESASGQYSMKDGSNGVGKYPTLPTATAPASDIFAPVARSAKITVDPTKTIVH